MPEKGMLRQALDNQSNPGMDKVMGAATDIAKHIADAEHRADHDPMTGLLNKEAFKKILQARIEEAGETGRELGVIFIDLKDFKQVNDKYGHEKGDEVIIKSAEVVVDTVRTNETDHPDIVSNEVLYLKSDTGRLGGDEIAVILDLTPGTDKRDTELTPEERLLGAQSRIYENFHARQDIKETGVGISIGGAVLLPNETAEQLLARADQAMYEHKQEQIRENGAYRS